MKIPLGYTGSLVDRHAIMLLLVSIALWLIPWNITYRGAWSKLEQKSTNGNSNMPSLVNEIVQFWDMFLLFPSWHFSSNFPLLFVFFTRWKYIIIALPFLCKDTFLQSVFLHYLWRSQKTESSVLLGIPCCLENKNVLKGFMHAV